MRRYPLLYVLRSYLVAELIGSDEFWYEGTLVGFEGTLVGSEGTLGPFPLLCACSSCRSCGKCASFRAFIFGGSSSFRAIVVLNSCSWIPLSNLYTWAVLTLALTKSDACPCEKKSWRFILCSSYIYIIYFISMTCVLSWSRVLWREDLQDEDNRHRGGG